MKSTSLVLFILTAFISCKNIDEKSKAESSNPIKSEAVKAANKEEDIRRPSSEFEICEGGIGKLLLGDSFSSIDNKFSKVDTLTMSSEGMDWPAKSIDLGNGEWIFAEATDGEDIITRLHTNSKKYKTPKGFHIGQSFEDILKSGEEIGLDIDEGFMSIRLHGEKVSITVDSISENHFYNSKNQDLNDIPKNAKIIEFGIF